MLVVAGLLPYALFDFLANFGGFEPGQPRAPVRVKLSGARVRLFAGVSCALVLLTASLFLALPRPPGGSLLGQVTRQSTAATGFSDRVELGTFNRIVNQGNIVMAVETDVPTYWRGKAFDRYSDGSWSESVDRDLNGPVFVKAAATNSITRKFKLFNMTLVNDQRLSAGSLVAARPLNAPWAMRTKALYATLHIPVAGTPPSQRAYSLTSTRERYIRPASLGTRRALFHDGTIASFEERELFLQLPSELPQRIRDLAGTVTLGRDSVAAKALAIEAYLEANYAYSRVNLAGGTQEPLEHFLFDARSGHCEYFATAMAILMRCAGVPSRVVAGFVPGTFVDGNYVVRLSDAHLWCEVHYPGKGWLIHDPSPGGEERLSTSRELGWFEQLQIKWYTHVLQYDGAAQHRLTLAVQALASRVFVRLAGSVTRALRYLWPLPLALLGLYLLRRAGLRWPAFRHPFSRRRRSPLERVRSHFGQYLREIARKGYRRSPGTTPNDLLVELARDGTPVVDEARLLTGLFYRARFGGQALTREDETSVKGAVAAVRRWARG